MFYIKISLRNFWNSLLNMIINFTYRIISFLAIYFVMILSIFQVLIPPPCLRRQGFERGAGHGGIQKARSWRKFHF